MENLNNKLIWKLVDGGEDLRNTRLGLIAGHNITHLPSVTASEWKRWEVEFELEEIWHRDSVWTGCL